MGAGTARKEQWQVFPFRLAEAKRLDGSWGKLFGWDKLTFIRVDQVSAFGVGTDGIWSHLGLQFASSC